MWLLLSGCVALIVLGAAMLLADVGDPLVWVALTIVAMASFVLALAARRAAH